MRTPLKLPIYDLVFRNISELVDACMRDKIICNLLVQKNLIHIRYCVFGMLWEHVEACAGGASEQIDRKLKKYGFTK